MKQILVSLLIKSPLINPKSDFYSDLDSESEHRWLSSYVTDPSCSHAYINDLAIVSALCTTSWHIQYN